MDNKITRKDALTFAIGLVKSQPDFDTKNATIETLEKMVVSLERKTPKKPSAKTLEAAQERERLNAEVRKVLADGNGHSVGDLAEMFGVSTAKLAAAFAGDAGAGVERIKHKGKTMWKLTEQAFTAAQSFAEAAHAFCVETEQV